MSRVRSDDGPASITITFRATSAERRDLETLCRHFGNDRSTVLRRLIDEAITFHELCRDCAGTIGRHELVVANVTEHKRIARWHP